MRTVSTIRRGRVGINMTPMIDVVFLLIIFFLVAGHLASREARLPLDLPVAGRAATAVGGLEPLIVNVRSDGSVWVAGTRVDDDRLDQLIRAHVDRHGETAAMRIRTDRDVPYGRIEPLLRQAALAGISQLTFAVRENE